MPGIASVPGGQRWPASCDDVPQVLKQYTVTITAFFDETIRATSPLPPALRLRPHLRLRRHLLAHYHFSNTWPSGALAYQLQPLMLGLRPETNITFD